jgi:hypothetical protein
MLQIMFVVDSCDASMVANMYESSLRCPCTADCGVCLTFRSMVHLARITSHPLASGTHRPPPPPFAFESTNSSHPNSLLPPLVRETSSDCLLQN